MSSNNANNLTLLLKATQEGDTDAERRLFDVVHGELRDMARRNRFVGKHGETLQATAVANEVYLYLHKRLHEGDPLTRTDQATFFRTAALAIRSILRDHWRQHIAQKRGGVDQVTPLHDGVDSDKRRQTGRDAAEFLALDEALDRLECYNVRWWEVVMHRFFAGRTIEQTAQLMDVGVTHVKKDWKCARAWLHRELRGD